MTEIPKGYKHTEVGVIPEEWEVKRLGVVSDIKTGPFGSSLHERDYVNDGTPIITVEHLGEFGIIHNNMPMVSDADKKRLSAYSMQTNDIVFSRVGSVDRNSLVSEKENGWLFSGRLLRIRINSKSILPKYLSYHFHQETFKQRIRSVAVGQTMASLNTQILKEIDVIIPSNFPEQRAIAAALSDMDALIEAQEKLIAKKKAIKQGAMQELLRPKEGWEVKRLGEVANVTMGQSPLSKYYNSEGIGLPLVQGNADVKDRKTIVRFYTSEITKKGKHGDIIMSVRAPVGEVSKASFDCCLGRGVCSITFKNEYLYHFLINFEKSWSRFSTGSTFDSVNSKQVNELEILIPKEVYEQTRIARILSDMDSEIAQLEAQLDKYRNLKQGMMQELLTGRKRLIHDFGGSDIPQENNQKNT
jgi:type I restriction enzyme, S subunit